MMRVGKADFIKNLECFKLIVGLSEISSSVSVEPSDFELTITDQDFGDCQIVGTRLLSFNQ